MDLYLDWIRTESSSKTTGQIKSWSGRVYSGTGQPITHYLQALTIRWTNKSPHDWRTVKIGEPQDVHRSSLTCEDSPKVNKAYKTVHVCMCRLANKFTVCKIVWQMNWDKQSSRCNFSRKASTLPPSVFFQLSLCRADIYYLHLYPLYNLCFPPPTT